MKNILPSIICLFFIVKATAQERRKFFYATIQDEVSAVSSAHVINLNTKQGTFTNNNGEFRILAKVNDTLQISFVGYKTKNFVVNINNFGIQESYIQLKKVPIELDEVAIKKHNLLGYISSDSKHIKSEKEINAETLKLPFAGSRILTPAERRLYTGMGGRPMKLEGLGFVLSTDYIINSISGRLRKLKNNKAIEDREKRIENIRNNYHIVIEHEIKILKEDIDRFIYFAESANDFNTLYLNNEVAMITFLQQKSEEFKKLNPKKYN
ncbi:carboxypeptidase-like regulatory domain-containing protein [Tenacibaculum larymnensis]|uniref:Carboxypeptidase-like regulatory domain-containing protein n=1 Tax=Tenacibaculum larymnensis TaxID=2878201 RepID=A0A9X4EUF7_9FLAO|nr:carboxypeptidase-like regulatory domain-containing protein [Tenacibaculum larymnensis]MDE1206581.1 carboxypeptidase-like regulatory domain-containing protein [Tenacibaculum larymnensis]